VFFAPSLGARQSVVSMTFMTSGPNADRSSRPRCVTTFYSQFDSHRFPVPLQSTNDVPKPTMEVMDKGDDDDTKFAAEIRGVKDAIPH
jgi:hypothetical protein